MDVSKIFGFFKYRFFLIMDSFYGVEFYLYFYWSGKVIFVLFRLKIDGMNILFLY